MQHFQHVNWNTWLPGYRVDLFFFSNFMSHHFLFTPLKSNVIHLFCYLCVDFDLFRCCYTAKPFYWHRSESKYLPLHFVSWASLHANEQTFVNPVENFSPVWNIYTLIRKKMYKWGTDLCQLISSSKLLIYFLYIYIYIKKMMLTYKFLTGLVVTWSVPCNKGWGSGWRLPLFSPALGSPPVYLQDRAGHVESI